MGIYHDFCTIGESIVLIESIVIFMCNFIYTNIHVCSRMNCNEALSQKSRKHKHAIKKITQERAGK
jgi:hypothetical protein